MWYTLFLSFHVTFGVLALLVFWIPLVTKKGGRQHIRYGTFFLFCLLFVVVTALMWSSFQLITQQLSIKERNFYLFITFVVLFTAEAGYYGRRVIRTKPYLEPNYHLIDVGFSGMLVLSGLLTSLYGIFMEELLIALFPWIGILLGLSHLKYWLRPATKGNQWFFEHMAAMFTCVIATLTAFVVIAVPRWLPIASDSLLLWFGPTVLLVPLLQYFKWVYRGNEA